MNWIERAAVSRFTNMLAEKGVQFVEGADCPATNGHTVFMPDLTDKDLNLNQVCGWAMHEAGHILYTDFAPTRGCDGLLHSLTNALEDTRIEAKLCKEFAGAPVFLNASEEGITGKNGSMLSACRHGVAAALTTYCCLDGIVRRPMAPVAELKPDLDEGRRFLVSKLGEPTIARLDKRLETVPTLKNTAAVIKLAEKILEEIKFPPPPPSKGKGKGKKSEQPEQSESSESESSKSSEKKSEKGSKGSKSKSKSKSDKSESDKSESGKSGEDESDAGKSDEGKAESKSEGKGEDESDESKSKSGSAGSDGDESDESKSESEDEGKGKDGDEDSEDEDGEGGEGGEGGPSDSERSDAVKELERANDEQSRSFIQNHLGDQQTANIADPRTKEEDAVSIHIESKFEDINYVSGLRRGPTRWRRFHSSDGLAYGTEIVEKAKVLSAAVRTVLAGIMQAKSRSAPYLARSGLKLSSPALHRLASGDLRVFNRADAPRQKFNTAVEVVLDRSGSMYSIMGEAMQAALGMTLAVRGTPGCKAGLIAFDADSLVAADPLEEDWQRCVDVLDIESKNLSQQDIQRIGLAGESGGENPTHTALARALTVLEGRKEDRKIILAVTDDDVDNYPVIKQRAEKVGIDIYFVVLTDRASSRCIENLKFLTKGFEILPVNRTTFVTDFRNTLFRLARKGMFGMR